MSTRREVVIRGVGTSDYGRFAQRRVESLAWEAITEAMRDADVEAREIEAVFVGSVFGPPGVATRTLRGIGIGGVPVLTIEAACASGTAAYHEAVEAVAFGRYACVLVFGVEHLSSLFTSGAIVPEATDPELRYEARTFFSDGSQGYDLMGMTRDQIISDVLVQFERYLQLVRLPETALLVGAPEHAPEAPPRDPGPR